MPEAMLMIRPLFCFRMDGTKAREQRKLPPRLTSMVRSQSSSLMPTTGDLRYNPASLSRMSTRPKRSNVMFANRFTADSLATFPSTGMASLPNATSSLTTSLALSAWRSATTTLAPSCPKPRAMTRPIPCAPPVTTATFPCNLMASRASVYMKGLARDPVAFRRRQKVEGFGKIFRLPGSPQRDLRPTLLARFGRFFAHDSRRIRRTRRDRIDQNPVRGELLGERFRKSDDPRLRRRIRRAQGRARHPVVRRGIENAPAFLLLHDGRRLATHEECAFQIHVDDFFPL